jgi:hypothetical protein
MISQTMAEVGLEDVCQAFHILGRVNPQEPYHNVEHRIKSSLVFKLNGKGATTATTLAVGNFSRNQAVT